MTKTVLAAALMATAGFCMAAEQVPLARASTPAAPYNDWTRKWWHQRFDEKKKLANATDYKIVFFGDSITHNWENNGKAVWDANFAEGEYKALNCGFSGDRTEHLLWRLEHGQFGTSKPKAVVLMIGTNNTGHFSPDDEAPVDTIAGIREILVRLRELYPETKVILHPIFPRSWKPTDGARLRNDIVNEQLPFFADGKRVVICDFNEKLAPGGILTREMMGDALHPGKAGYEIWATELKPYLDWALGKTAELPKPGPAMPTAIPPATNAPPRNAVCGPAWFNDGRFQQKRGEVRANLSHYYDLVMVGDSITHFWDDAGKDVAARAFAGYNVLNLGFSGDCVQNAIWNCELGGCLSGFSTKLVTVMIGTNNSKWCKPEDTAAGIKRLLDVIRQKQVCARILLHPIFPRGEKPDNDRRLENEKVNEIIKGYCDGLDIIWVDFNDKLTEKDGTLTKEMMPDFLHPAAPGYEIWANAILPYVKGEK